MNHPFVIAAAALDSGPPRDRRSSRTPTPRSTALPADLRPAARSMKTLTAVREFLGKTPLESRRWQSLAQALLMTNEFMFVD